MPKSKEEIKAHRIKYWQEQAERTLTRFNYCMDMINRIEPAIKEMEVAEEGWDALRRFLSEDAPRN